MGYYFGPVAVDDLTTETITKIRQAAYDRAVAAYLMRNLRRFLLPTHVRRAIERAYHQKYIMKPVEELTDEDILSIRNIGPKSLSEIRKLLPAPRMPENREAENDRR